MNHEFKPCAVIPVYNHGSTVGAVVDSLVARGLPVILVDDGSAQETKAQLAQVAQRETRSKLFTLEKNSGKGGAVTHGLLKAWELGYTHGLQVDADGQHDLDEVDLFLKESRENPSLLVAGRPEYDESVPTSRKIGRKITNFWVAVETWSRDIPDAMCGFRCYPLQATCGLLAKKKIRQRMEFDIEILVRLHWRGLKMKFFPVKVIYPEGGISNFRMLQDNLAISGMHFCLFFGMIPRIPLIIRNKILRKTGGN